MLAKVLYDLWSQAYDAGWQFAESELGRTIRQDPLVKRELLDRLSREWAGEIAQTRIDQLAAILRAGGTEAELQAAVERALASPDSAELIARTEIARAFSLGSSEAYKAAGTPEVLWLTSGDANVCPVCAGNEAAGPIPLGSPFPSGALYPPQHPRCRCVLIPA